MQQLVYKHTLANGLTILGEPMPWLESVAFTLMFPGGTAREESDRLGLAGMTLELSQRGCGRWSSREVVEQLDFLGVERSSSVSSFYTSISMSAMASVLETTFEVAVAMVREPHFPEEELEEVRQSALLELAAIEDDPAQKCFVELKRSRFSDPFGRSSLGRVEGIESVTHTDCVEFHHRHAKPQGAVLSIAGRFDWEDFLKLVERTLGSWSGDAQSELGQVEPQVASVHIPHESQQTHIALAYDSVPYQHPEYYRGRGIVGILSDGMSSRLFTEVREKRGLVYAISASSHSLKNCGSVLCYAGTTSARAQETLDVTIETIRSISSGIELGELSRLKSRARTSLVMEQESSVSRSSQLAYDWITLGRTTTRQEVLEEIEQLTAEKLIEHFSKYPPKRWTLVTIGPEPLEFHDAV
ncbi:MAG: M16 family metallopeptidase [Planctomycetota bacterium]|jgi:predicted Zn-dependent peptidase|nr:insulinase family protein [Planctomycetaceae bacterium]